MEKIFFVMGMFAMVCLLSAPAFADSYTWTGGGADNNMLTSGNWNSGIPSDWADILTFATGGTRANSNNGAERSAQVIFDTDTNFTIGSSGGVLGIGNITPSSDGITADPADANYSPTYTISAPVVLYDSQTWTVSNNGTGKTTLAVSGAIGQNGGVFNLTKAGTGTLTLSGANTYSGGTTISAGILNIQNDSALGSGSVSVASGATLQLQGGIAPSVGLTLNGTGSTGSNGALENLSGNNTYTGAITLGSAATIQNYTGNLTVSGTINNEGKLLTVQGAGNTFFSNVVSGTGGLTQAGTGILVLTDANTYTGATTINSGGTLSIGNGATTGSLSTSSVITDNGTLLFGSTGAFTQGTDFASGILGIGSVAKDNAGILTLSGTNSYSGGTDIQDGTVDATTATALGTGAVTLGLGVNSATLQVGAVGGTYANAIALAGTGTLMIQDNGGGTTFSGSVTGTGNLTIDETQSGGITLSAVNINNSGTITNNGGSIGPATISGVIGSNVSNVIEDGVSTLVLQNSSNNQGATTIKFGILYASAIGALGSGTVTLGSGANTVMLAVAAAGTYTNPIALNGTGSLTIEDVAGGTIFSGGVTSTNTNGNQNLTIDEITSSGINFSGLVNNSGSIINSGSSSGTATISGGVGSHVTSITESSASGSALNITGGLAVNGSGTTLIDTNGSLTISSGSVSGTGNLILQNNSFTYGGVNIGGGAINNNGTITNSGSEASTEITAQIGSNVTDVIEDSATSNLILTNSNNAQTTTTITSGAVQVWALGALGSGIVTLGSGANSGAILFVTAAGTYTNAIALNGTGSQVIDDYVGGTTFTGGVTGGGNLSIIEAQSGSITFSGATLNNAGSITNEGNGSGSAIISANIGPGVTGGVAEISTSPLVLSGANTYTGPTIVTRGTLEAGISSGVGNGPFGNGSNVTVGAGYATATLDVNGNAVTIGSLAGASDGIVTNSAAGTPETLTVGNTTSTTFSGQIKDGTSVLGLTYVGTGTLTLAGVNTYGGPTTVSAGTLSVDGSIVSPVTVNSGGNLAGLGEVSNTVLINSGGSLSPGDPGTIGHLTINGALTMSTGSTLDVVLKSSTAYSQLILLHNGNSLSGSTLSVSLASGAAISNGNEFLVINSGTTTTTGTPAVTYSGSGLTFDSGWGTLDGDYGFILTAEGQSQTYASQATNNNARAAGAVLDNIQAQGASGDMLTVLNALGGLSSSGVASALNTMSPIVDRGVMDTSTSSLNNFIGASIERAQNVLIAAVSGDSNTTGVSAGDPTLPNGLWAKQYGGYIDQGTRDGIEGYNAWNTGTAVGLDRMFTDNLTIGASLGYAYGSISSDANSASTYINSGEGTLYAAYQGQNHPYFIDAAGSFANNWYNGQRDISVGAINRIADSQYQGQQTGVYLDGGYKFDVGHKIVLTPLASLQWTHLALGSYAETNAGDLNLMVNRQSYNILESGLGASISAKEKYNWGNLTPEFHAKWLYDFINDDMSVTSQFTGGGASFVSTGANPARNAANIGGSLSFDFKHDISLIAGVDTEIKDNFFGVYGSVSLRYKF